MRRLATNDFEICAAYHAGEGVWSIAKRLKVSQMTVWRRLNRTGQAMRPFSGHCYAAQIDTGVSCEGRQCLAVDDKGVCENQAIADELYCKKHKLRTIRHGDPTIILKRGRKGK
jgi:hypothetical protein